MPSPDVNDEADNERAMETLAILDEILEREKKENMKGRKGK